MKVTTTLATRQIEKLEKKVSHPPKIPALRKLVKMHKNFAGIYKMYNLVQHEMQHQSGNKHDKITGGD